MSQATRWEKLGRLLRAEGQRPWMQTHTAMPMALALGGTSYRVYFGTRDRDNRPHIGFVELDLRSPTDVVSICEDFVLGPGRPGCFDDNGIYPGPLVPDGDRLLMYVDGRSNGVPPLYYMSIGLAESRDGGRTFEKIHDAPIMGRTRHDPWMVSTPWVIREPAGWRMWYLSGTGWESADARAKSFYDIKYAESDDGVNWRREGKVAIARGAGETNIAAPTVVVEDGVYRMWYSYVAGAGYRIGYAESEQGLHWTRKDEAAGIELSRDGWDSESMAYPCVFAHEGRKYLLYSGNGNGRDGIGIAVAS